MRPTCYRGRGGWPYACLLGAFTLIEMLTVIAIIAVLAGILIPTTILVMKKTRAAAARADLTSLASAVIQYTNDFGVPPPDRNTFADDPGGAGYAPFTDMNTPNECLVWFLTREYVQSFRITTGQGGWSPGPEATERVHARVRSEPSFNLKTKQKTDYDQDGFYEFVDHWGRPYMYRAWAPQWDDCPAADAAAPSGNTVTFTLHGHSDLDNVIGRIELHGFAVVAYNGTFDFKGTDSNKVAIDFSSPPGGTPTGKYRFPLHNRGGVDLYSLGPNGLTRGVARPEEAGAAKEWKPWLNQSSEWAEVWGTAGDGNDLQTGGNLINDDRAKDDICNWQ